LSYAVYKYMQDETTPSSLDYYVWNLQNKVYL